MDPKIKILIVFVPFAIAGYVGFSLLGPLVDEVKTRDTALEEKKVENDNLSSKIQTGSQINAKQAKVQKEIDALRESVPKSPDIDLLTIDLEKMCKDAGMNFVAIKNPTNDGSSPGPVNSPAPEMNKAKAKSDKLKNMLKGGGTNAAAQAGQAAAEAVSGSELSHASKQIIVTGDFNGLEKLVNELETYQRVVKIDNINWHLPKKSAGKDKIKIDDSALTEGEEVGSPDLLFITMDITTYYLP